MAEAQEEILWICEATQVRVIGATQVPELLATEGLPSRSEITDAAGEVRAECVMLQGPLYRKGGLNDILKRMESHQQESCSTR